MKSGEISTIVTTIVTVLSLGLNVYLIISSRFLHRNNKIYNPGIFETFVSIEDNKGNKGEVYIYKSNNVRKWKGYILGEHINSHQSNFEFKIQAINDIKGIYKIIL